MKLKLLLSFVLCINVMYISAQSDNNANYSMEEYQTFAKIYKYTLDNPFDIISSTQKHLKTLTISEQRISEILQSQFSGKQIDISSSEIRQLEKLQRMIAADQNQHTDKLQKFIVANDMKLSTYREIRSNYSKIEKVRNQVNKLSASN